MVITTVVVLDGSTLITTNDVWFHQRHACVLLRNQVQIKMSCSVPNNKVLIKHLV